MAVRGTGLGALLGQLGTGLRSWMHCAALCCALCLCCPQLVLKYTALPLAPPTAWPLPAMQPRAPPLWVPPPPPLPPCPALPLALSPRPPPPLAWALPLPPAALPLVAPPLRAQPARYVRPSAAVVCPCACLLCFYCAAQHSSHGLAPERLFVRGGTAGCENLSSNQAAPTPPPPIVCRAAAPVAAWCLLVPASPRVVRSLPLPLCLSSPAPPLPPLVAVPAAER